MTAVSIVIPVYNSEIYLQRFVASLQAQTFKDFEALFINDSSTDGSAALLSGLAAADPRLKLLQQPKNLGAGAARNLGIRAAAGETLCFADPDDILPKRSLEARYSAFKKHNAIVRACNDEISDTGALIQHGTRPSNLPELCKPREAAQDFGVNPFVSAHWTWLFPTRLLQRQGIFNEENTRTAEDIMLLVRLFFKIERLVWLPDTVYYWVKREKSLSTTRYSYDHYADYLRCVDVFYEEAEKNRAVALGDRFCDDYLWAYLTHCARQCMNGHSTEEDVRRLVALAADICARHTSFTRIPDDSGKAARYVGLSMLRRVLDDASPLMIQRLANAFNAALERHMEAKYAAIRQSGWQTPARFDKYDARQRLLRARYLFCGEHPEESFTHAGRPLQAAFAKNRLEYRGKEFTVFERIVWLPVPAAADGLLELHLDSREAGLKHTPAEIRQAFTPPPPDERALPVEARVVRKFVQSVAASRFKDAWLFIDKDNQADDNAEHLYRWVMRHHPEINAWFALAEDSHDWPRLAGEGFRLVPFGSVEHKALFILCANLISSQMDRYIFTIPDEDCFADLRCSRFICLPHGVTKDDVSGWFNSIPFDGFVAATSDEAASIVSDGTPYLMTAREVVLGGFPRYDQWMTTAEPENIIFIMPTWRADLVGVWDGKGQKRAINPDFHSSSYVKNWKEVFDDPRMQTLLDTYGYRTVFFAHPGFEDYLAAMPFPDFVEKRSKVHGSIIDMMRKSKMMITDFSSVAYDMAYMKRPVLYYQYEDKDSFTRSQRWVSGYIDYKSMGFGPVCADRDELFAALEEALRSGCAMPALYEARVDTTFPYRDADCCRRAFEFIAAGSQPLLRE